MKNEQNKKIKRYENIVMAVVLFFVIINIAIIFLFMFLGNKF